LSRLGRNTTKSSLITSEEFYLEFYHYQFSLINNAVNYNTVISDNSFFRVTIPEAAYIRLRRRPPEDEQGNARNV
jgi:hypothetical protein